MPKEWKTEWKYGDQKRLAERSGVISQSHLSEIINGHKRCSPEKAKHLTRAALDMGYVISRTDWIYPEESNNPLLVKGG